MIQIDEGKKSPIYQLRTPGAPCLCEWQPGEEESLCKGSSWNKRCKWNFVYILYVEPAETSKIARFMVKDLWSGVLYRDPVKYFLVYFFT